MTMSIHISDTDRMVKKRLKFSTNNYHRDLEYKSWEINILQQVAFFRSCEDAALRLEVLAQVKTLQSRAREVCYMITVLKYKINLEEVEAKVCKEKALGETSPSLPKGWKPEVWVQLSHTWYLERAQEHRSRAQKLLTTRNYLLVTMKELNVSTKRQLLLATHITRQTEELPHLSAKAAGHPRLCGVKRRALHNNLLTLLEAQKKATARQEEAAAAQEELCQIQLKSTSSMKAYYNTTFCTV